MDEKNAPLERIKQRYNQRALNLNATADVSLAEAIGNYCESQEKTLATAEELAENTYKDASEKANATIEASDKAASDSLIAAYVQFGVRK